MPAKSQLTTVEDVSYTAYKYSLTSIKRPPSIKRPLSKVPIYLSVICCT